MRPRPLIPLVAGALLLTAEANAASTLFQATGTDAAGIQATVDDFRNALGGLNANQPVNNAGGRRQIDWDAAPDAVSDPNPFPGDFFNADFNPRARGIEFRETGDTTGFLLSSTAASGQPVEFGFDEAFDVFSPERLFSPVGGTTFDVLFFDPANTSDAATTTGLGVVFTDVDILGETTMSFFDIDGNLLIEQEVLAQNEGLSFLGVLFDTAVVAKVSITAGNLPLLGNGLQGTGIDGVAMDDFIFGEPTPVAGADVPLPASVWLMGAALAGLGWTGRRKRRA